MIYAKLSLVECQIYVHVILQKNNQSALGKTMSICNTFDYVSGHTPAAATKVVSKSLFVLCPLQGTFSNDNTKFTASCFAEYYATNKSHLLQSSPQAFVILQDYIYQIKNWKLRNCQEIAKLRKLENGKLQNCKIAKLKENWKMENCKIAEK